MADRGQELWLSGARDLGSGGDVSLLVRDEHVAAGSPGSGARTLDADGLWLAPGFIDLQLNGAFGHDFTAEPDAVWLVGERLAATGVTAFLPTLVSSPAERYDDVLKLWATRPAASAGSQPLGWHFEGPMLSSARAGAHAAEHLALPAQVDLGEWTREDGVLLVTLAPELPGAQAAIGRLASAGVAVAAGHTDADASSARVAVDAGVRYATHLLNAMRGLDHRAPGIGVGLLLDPRVTVGIIADRHHLAGATLDLVWRVAGASRVSLVSDGIAALGAAPGRWTLGDATVSVTEDNSARLDDGTLAGAVAPLPKALRNLVAATGCSMEEAVGCVTQVPARLLGLADRGHLRPGARADAVLLDDGFGVAATLIGGRPVHVGSGLSWA